MNDPTYPEVDKKKRNWFLCGTWHHLTLESPCCGFPSLAGLKKWIRSTLVLKLSTAGDLWWQDVVGFSTPLIATERDEFGFLQKINPEPRCHQFPASLCDRWVFPGFSDMFHARLPVISASWPMEMQCFRGFPWQTMQAEMMKTTLRWIQDSKKLLFQLGASNFATILWVLMLILVDIYSWALCFHRSM